ncbi:ferredoxin [Candidatus Magnetomorum sp. HK-1]|nr:ferredoxin [Candidatus Magnetomorum sp. HK-1]
MEGIDIVSELMNIAAITAPKSKGENYVQTRTFKGDILKKLANAMREFGEQNQKKDFDRDAKNIELADSVLLIGLKNASVLGLNCNACGFESCTHLIKHPQKSNTEFNGPVCMFRLLDMGIALGSAVKTAGMLNVDNRIMYRVGVVARQMGLIDWDIAMGIPLSVSGKNIFFDR